MSMPRTQTRILLVDDHTLFRESLRRLLDSESSLTVTADFPTAGQAIAAIRAGLIFDVALIDYELNTQSAPPDPRGLRESRDETSTGIGLLRQIHQLRPHSRILFVTAGMDLPNLVRAVRDLNAGIFLKTEPTAELLLAIERTAAGERWISSNASLSLFAAQDPAADPTLESPQALGAREAKVLRGVLEGFSNKEIGARIGLTESSVKAVLQKLFEKTGVRSRSQLVRYAIEAQIQE